MIEWGLEDCYKADLTKKRRRILDIASCTLATSGRRNSAYAGIHAEPT